jgi:hypothetical protein
MPGLLADKNIEGQFKALFHLYQSEPWRELWDSLALTVQTFSGLGLSPDVSDLYLWQECQYRGTGRLFIP